jgi:hypothetical protein
MGSSYVRKIAADEEAVANLTVGHEPVQPCSSIFGASCALRTNAEGGALISVRTSLICSTLRLAQALVVL